MSFDDSVSFEYLKTLFTMSIDFMVKIFIKLPEEQQVIPLRRESEAKAPRRLEQVLRGKTMRRLWPPLLINPAGALDPQR